MTNTRTRNPFPNLLVWLPQLIALFTLVILLTQTYQLFITLPYIGFNINPVTGEIVEVFVPDGPVQPGDHILALNSITWTNFENNLTQAFVKTGQAGAEIPLVIERDQTTISFQWSVPGPTRSEIQYRLISQWWLAYLFWLVGVLTVLFVRPRNKRWWLFIAFNFLTAIWVIVSTLSRWHYGSSALILRAVLWLSLPVYWHLHWVFPRPLRKLPRWAWVIGYTTGVIMMVLSWVQLLPAWSHVAAFILAAGGSFGLLLCHYIYRPEERYLLRFVLVTVSVVFALLISLSIVNFNGIVAPISGAALFSMPIVPLSYFYIFYRHQLGGTEIRVNRLIVFYFYILFNSVLVFFLLAITYQFIPISSTTIWIVLATANISGLLAAIGFQRLKRYIEQYFFLQIPLAPSNLLEQYAAQIISNLDRRSLADFIQKSILPSLLIGQSALVRLEGDNRVDVIYMDRVVSEQIPDRKNTIRLLKQASQNRPIVKEKNEPYSWIRMMLPLKIGREVIGVWYFGKRDPNDVYSYSDLSTFRALANQTAIALYNIIQTENLHMMHQANITRQDEERKCLALVLHDDILNDIAALGMFIDEKTYSAQFQETYERLTARLRQTIRNLRPSILEYGLWFALEQTAEYLLERYNANICLDVCKSHVRYPEYVEQHLLGIIHQSLENALKHSGTKNILIEGNLLPNEIHLSVMDKGQGFTANSEQFDLKQLLANKHFGLIGMYERASLIKADLKIDSRPGWGTQIIVTWQLKEDHPVFNHVTNVYG